MNAEKNVKMQTCVLTSTALQHVYEVDLYVHPPRYVWTGTSLVKAMWVL